MGSGMGAASIRCCTRRPEGPAAVPFGKDFRILKTSKSSFRDMGCEVVSGIIVFIS